MQEISVYLNNHASQAGVDFWENEIKRKLFRSHLSFRKPNTHTELQELLEGDVARNVDTIVSVGGDGTVNTLIQKLAGRDIRLLVIPGGTANDLANELGTLNSLDHAMAKVRSREIKNIDLISVNGHLMATNGGIGLGGAVAQKINSIRKKVPLFKNLMKMTGKRIYTFFAATELLDPSMPYYRFKVESDEFCGEVEGPGLLINNQCTLAGSFHVAPQTLNNDGKFNVTIFTHPNRGRLIQCLYAMGSGEAMKDPHLITFETTELRVELVGEREEVPFFGDGEILQKGHSWDIKVLPEALKVYGQNGGQDLAQLVNEVSLS